MSTPPILGRERETSNPLLILANAMDTLRAPLEEIAQNTRPDATVSLPHRYSMAIYTDAGHGKVWGSFCIACTHAVSEYVYPCQLEPNEPLKPPAFFTIGDVFEVDELGRLLKNVGSTPSSDQA